MVGFIQFTVRLGHDRISWFKNDLLMRIRLGTPCSEVVRCPQYDLRCLIGSRPLLAEAIPLPAIQPNSKRGSVTTEKPLENPLLPGPGPFFADSRSKRGPTRRNRRLRQFKCTSSSVKLIPGLISAIGTCRERPMPDRSMRVRLFVSTTAVHRSAF